MTEQVEKLDFLDALRGIAILMVLWVHAGDLVELFGQRVEVARLGQRGVQLFYVVSAFSLLYSAHARTRDSFKTFFLRRFFRIAPLFYLSLLANIVYTRLVLGAPLLSPAAYLSGVTFLFGYSPSTINSVVPAGWSVAVETSFYLLFPLLLATLRSFATALAGTCIAMAVCFFLCYQVPIYPAHWPNEYIQFLWFPVQLPVFCMGFVAFYAWREFGLSPQVSEFTPEWLRRPALRRMTSLALLAMAGGILYATHPVNNLRLYLNSSSFVFLVLGLAVHPWKLLVNPVVCSIGRLSYSVYLCHPYLAGVVAAVVLWVSSRLGWPVYGTYLGLVLAFSVFLLGSLAMASLSFPLVEQRGIAFGKRLTRRLGRPAPIRALV